MDNPRMFFIVFYDFFNIRMPVWAGNLGPIYNGLLTFGFVILVFMMLKYYLTPMLLVADENIEIEEAFHMSDIISKKSVKFGETCPFENETVTTLNVEANYKGDVE